MLYKSYLLALLVFVQSITMIARGQSPDTLVLHFGFNQDRLRQEEAQLLKNFIHRPGVVINKLLVTGYADTTGTNVYNQRLSLHRARSVAGSIAGLLTRPPSIMISARGEGEPIEGSDSLSRRVEVTYLSYTTTTTISTDFIVHATKMKKVVDTPAEPAPKSAAISSPTPNATSAGPTPYAPQPDTIITLANINFIEDSPNLTEASRMIIPEYVRMLQRYKADSLEIDGYCHSLTPITNTSDPLFKLSVQRAKLIFDYLVDEGFDRTRLSYKGMGNATPKNEHPVTADEARANMRVEIRVFQRKHR